MLRCHRLLSLSFSLSALAVLGCGEGDESTGSLDDFLPEVPAPTGEPQRVWAGAITQDNPEELIPGPAASGMIGDYFLRNARGRYVIQAPTRVMGVVPQGGNLVDAVPLGPDGRDMAADHFGELSFMYLLGRTCEHQVMDVVQDGSGGGAAVLRALGVTARNDFINFRGIGLFNVTPALDPDIEDYAECATTYILEPDADHVRVLFTLYNADDLPLSGPMGVFNDTGGESGAFAPTRGFTRLGLEDLASSGDPTPIDYTLYQGPGVAYGILPRHPDGATTNAALLVSGVSVVLFNATTLFDILNADNFYLDIPAHSGITVALDIALGRDAAAIDAVFRAGQALGQLSGQVSFDDGLPAAGARVGVYLDSDGDGAIGDADAIATYVIADQDGAFSGRLPAGDYLARAEVENTARSATVALAVDPATEPAGPLDFTLPSPVYFDYTITDESGAPMPGRLTVIGRHPVPPDARLFDTHDRARSSVITVHSLRGTTVDIGDGADPRFALPAGATYRILASRGTEWSVADQVITVDPGMPDQELSFQLARVAPADGYVASEFHVHQIGSMDAPISNERRVASMVAEGVELFASTDHDYVADLQPVIEALGLSSYVRNIPGLETTPFAYGHFNAWPITPDESTPNRGAIDWAQGMAGYSMIPGEIFDAMRERGAELVQVNHPRTAFSRSASFLQYFDRAGLRFDYENRQIVGDLAFAPIPNDWLRLPEVSLWDDTFNALEVWNSLGMGDTNSDGVLEIVSLDIVMRDWFNFLTLGLVVTPTASSDTHSAYINPAGMPRTYVRVSDDSSQALASGSAIADVVATLSGADPRDVVLTNGPHIQVAQAGSSESALGAVLDGTSGSVTLDIDVLAPEWAAIDTLEVFANATPDLDADSSALQPLYCYTTRAPADLAENDVCALTPDGAQPLDVQLVPVASARRYQATVSLVVDAADIINHPMATGADTWLVFRVRGRRAIFPLYASVEYDDAELDILVSGTPEQQDAVLTDHGLPATAFTSPVFIDFDGNGYTSVLSPQ